MTYLNSPAADAGVSNMPDVIDSLKRLERIGSESSKTVEKILEAARELERKIASQYDKSSIAYVDADELLFAIAYEKKFAKAASSDEIVDYDRVEAAKSIGLDYNRVRGMRYAIENRYKNGFNQCLVRRGSSEASVSDSRENALDFASDLANGLLVLIEQDLLARHSKNQQALSILQKAIEQENTETKKPPDPF